VGNWIKIRAAGATMTRYVIREATVGDAATIAGHRVSMFRDMGQVPSDALAAELLERSTLALDAFLREGSYVGWFAVDESCRVLAGVGAHVKPQLPRISHDGGRGRYYGGSVGRERLYRTAIAWAGHRTSADDYAHEVGYISWF
jgi:hypothetical protein